MRIIDFFNFFSYSLLRLRQRNERGQPKLAREEGESEWRCDQIVQQDWLIHCVSCLRDFVILICNVVLLRLLFARLFRLSPWFLYNIFKVLLIF